MIYLIAKTVLCKYAIVQFSIGCVKTCFDFQPFQTENHKCDMSVNVHFQMHSKKQISKRLLTWKPEGQHKFCLRDKL